MIDLGVNVRASLSPSHHLPSHYPHELLPPACESCRQALPRIPSVSHATQLGDLRGVSRQETPVFSRRRLPLNQRCRQPYSGATHTQGLAMILRIMKIGALII